MNTVERNAALMEIRELIDKGRLVVDPRALPIFAGCMMVDPETFTEALRRLCRPKSDQITLYPDGLPEELSFGILWHSRKLYSWSSEENPAYQPPENGQQPFMVGGLIYRGPERGGRYDLPSQAKHEWTSHT